MADPGDRAAGNGDRAAGNGDRASIEERAAFDFVRYASVWEDADVLCAALAPVGRGGKLVSIASAGDNGGRPGWRDDRPTG